MDFWGILIIITTSVYLYEIVKILRSKDRNLYNILCLFEWHHRKEITDEDVDIGTVQIVAGIILRRKMFLNIKNRFLQRSDFTCRLPTLGAKPIGVFIYLSGGMCGGGWSGL